MNDIRAILATIITIVCIVSTVALIITGKEVDAGIAAIGASCAAFVVGLYSEPHAGE